MRFSTPTLFLSLLFSSSLVAQTYAQSTNSSKCYGLALADALDMGPYQAGVLSVLASQLKPEERAY